MSDATTDDDFVVEIDLGEMDWSIPAEWEDSPGALAPAVREPAPDATPADEPTATATPSKVEPAPPAVAPATLEAFEPAPALTEVAAAPPPASSHTPADASSTPAAASPTPAAASPTPTPTPTPTPADAPAAPTPTPSSKPAPASAEAAAAPNAQPLPEAFAEVVAGVARAPLRALVGATFARLLRALDTLSVIERALTRPKSVSVGPLFEEVRTQSVALLSQVTEAVSGGGLKLERRHREALDGLRFALGHELSKVFRQEFPGLAGDAGPAYTRADLSRAWGLLHNCLQQTAIALAQSFSPGVTGAALFEDYKSRVENSFALYRELNVLRRKVTAAEGSSGILLKHSLVRHLEHFREETMRLLMYRDWGEFGRYADDVKRAFEEMEEFEPVLHEFSQYLHTLIHHVGMREALRGVAPHDYDDEGDE